jgi:hypothetical protein
LAVATDRISTSNPPAATLGRTSGLTTSSIGDFLAVLPRVLTPHAHCSSNDVKVRIGLFDGLKMPSLWP